VSDLTIGEVARRAGVRASSIRYYESIGVLPEPERVAGSRRYDSETLRLLSVIGAAKNAGLSLAEIRSLLTTSASGEPVGPELRDLADRKLPEVEALIEHAQAVRRWLQAARACACLTLDDCPLFDPATAPGA
jgi:MerR family redox-sensitive transcriptional activator SoxR